ncbi:hypothetical protein PRIPAC_96802 [Pristionchus pacificus]|uniref:HLH domain-containing protein n=1 Tax=Pristionchus pacificus TaxID=54126 RepID=A0A2A6D0T2_PRIPA|nr:hypothetical protein PRIPAC_96802 [Pristionchus pacificus]|eukprot:PDM84015.1 HLH domain-containing protein [Pristionchus pacificus]
MNAREESEEKRGRRVDQDSSFSPRSTMIASPPRPTSPSVICQRYVLSDDELSETFDLLDVDKDGRLSRTEISALLRTVNVEPTRIELDFIFQEMDVNEEMASILMKTTDLTDRKVIHDMFKSTDVDGDGRISFFEFVRMMQE